MTQRRSRTGAELPPVILKPREERRLLAGHLWVFSNEIDVSQSPLGDFEPGQHVRVISSRERFLGYGYINPNTLISVRLLSRNAAPGPDLLRQRLKTALALRERLYSAPFYRLCFGEADLLPGLVVDRYGDVLVAQLATAGMEAQKDDILEVLKDLLAPKALLWKNDASMRTLEGLPLEVAPAFGEVPELIEVPEGGVRYQVSLATGQKTGWFYDQTANRARVARLSAKARVLDVFSYAGSFGLQAAKAGAASVLCVDSSAAALGQAKASAEASGLELETQKSDAFDAMQALGSAGRRFDIVVIDPPAFIKKRKDHPQGLAAYRRLNLLAMKLVESGGLLMSCSCSWHLGAEELSDAIQRAARQSGRFVQMIETGGQSPDHPVHPAIAETRYLKAFLCRVTDE